MTDQTASARGWAFLIARGRHKGYRSVLVPDFLVQSEHHGILAEAVGGDFPPSSTPRVETVTIPVIGAITLAYRTKRLTYADLHEEQPATGGGAAGHRPDDVVTDEHGRPLDLLYGFVCRASGIRRTHEGDLVTAYTQALHSYRRFLADERRFALETSRPFGLRSSTRGVVEASQVVTTPAAPSAPPDPPDAAAVPLVVVQSPLPRRIPALNFIIASLTLAIIVAVTLSIGGGSDPSIEITRDDLGDDWPLTVSSGTLECKDRSSITFTTVDGTAYAVNEAALSAGYLEIAPILSPGQDVRPLVDHGNQLCQR